MATLGKICLDYWPKKMHNGQQYTAKKNEERKERVSHLDASDRL